MILSSKIDTVQEVVLIEQIMTSVLPVSCP